MLLQGQMCRVLYGFEVFCWFVSCYLGVKLKVSERSNRLRELSRRYVNLDIRIDA